MMRIFFLFLSFLFTSNFYATKTKKDSLHIEELRDEAITLFRKGRVIESLGKVEFAIAKSKSANLSSLFIDERLKVLLANRYSAIGDFDRAIELAQYLESSFKKSGDLKRELKVKNNLGIYNRNIGRYDKAYQYFLIDWQIDRGRDEVAYRLDRLDGLTASCIELGRLKEAKTYLKEAKKLLDNLQSELKEELLLYYYINQSNYAIAIEDDAHAEENLLKCVEIAEKLEIRKGADVYKILATLLLKQGRSQEVIIYTDKIIKLIGADKDSLIKEPYLLHAYSLKAKALLTLNKHEEALNFCKKAEDQAAYFQLQYLFNESKLHIGELRRENLETGILALYHQYEESSKVAYLEQALIYVNQAKSNVLNERLANSKRLSLDNRKEAIEQRYRFIYQLNELEKEEGSSEVVALRNKLDSLNEELGIKSEKPFLVHDLRTFQNSLEKESIWLQYMEIDSLLFRFDIRKNKIEWSSEVIKTPEVIFDFYDVLRNPESTAQEFLSTSNNLPVLFPSNELKNSVIKEINIIPDGALNYVVFDAIPSNNSSKSWESISYMAEVYNFSYHFSIPSSIRNNTDLQVMDSYIGFAPDYSQSKEWAKLKNSDAALEQAQEYFGGSAYFGNQATKKNVRERSPSADILHLYAHGVSNDSSYDASYIMLQDGKMQVNEILALPLKARLCFLTACDVGLGKQFKGEGITSVAWAFKSAGVENVVQSMWKLNEQSSHQLMSLFFDHLAAGNNSSIALTQAKRQYLKNSEISNRLKHPYYWAGIGHYGNGAVFVEKANSYEEIVVGFMLALVGCLAIWVYIIKIR